MARRPDKLKYQYKDNRTVVSTCEMAFMIFTEHNNKNVRIYSWMLNAAVLLSSTDTGNRDLQTFQDEIWWSTGNSRASPQCFGSE